jgi:hypothetical protein
MGSMLRKDVLDADAVFEPHCSTLRAKIAGARDLYDTEMK